MFKLFTFFADKIWQVILILALFLLLGSITGFFSRKKAGPSQYALLSEIQYMGRLNLIEYHSEELIVIWGDRDLQDSKEKLDKAKNALNLAVNQYESDSTDRQNYIRMKSQAPNEKALKTLDIEIGKLDSKINKSKSKISGLKSDYADALEKYEKKSAKNIDMMFIAPAELSGYVDLAKVQIQKIPASASLKVDSLKVDTLLIQVPDPVLDKPVFDLDATLDQNLIYDLAGGLQIKFTPQGKIDYIFQKLKVALDDAGDAVLHKARKRGMIDQAKEQATTYLCSMIQALPGYENVHVKLDFIPEDAFDIISDRPATPLINE